MNHPLRLLGLALVTALGCAADADLDLDPDPSTAEALIVRGDGYFTLARDTRRCASPMCGGWWVTPVNDDRLRCADGTTQPRCYAADLDLAAASLPSEPATDVASEPGVVFRGSLQAVTHPAGRFGRLVITEAWRPAATPASTPDGHVERVSTDGVTCAFLPCARLAERRVVSAARPRLVAGLDLSALTLDDDTRDRVLADATTDAGALVRGLRVSLPGSPRVPAVRATQVYTRVVDDPRVCGAALASRLATATERLLQRSESDAPYTYFARDAWRSLPSDDALRRALALPVGTPIARVTLDRIVQGMSVVDPPGDLADAHRVARVRRLVATLRAQLTDIAVYRVGAVQVRVFILGRTRCGAVAGLETLLIET
ncbi:MAG: DUF6748 domain-containing protein [Polyangiales bacterium]